MDDEFSFEFLPEEKSQYASDTKPEIDPAFLELITIPANSTEIKIHPEAFSKLFDSPEIHGLSLSIFIVTGKDSNQNSDLIGIVLENLLAASKATSSEVINSTFFLTPKDDYKSKGLVAYSEPIFGIGSDGKKTAHFFLDVWGEFQDDFDPVYILLTGFGAAIASTIIYIEDGQIMERSWTWLRRMISVSRKILPPGEMTNLLFLINNWAPSEHGISGKSAGKNYIKSIINDPSTSPELDYVIKSLSPSPQCYAFPKILKEGNSSFLLLLKQQMKAFQQFISFHGAPKEIDGALAYYSSIFRMFKTLPTMEQLLKLEEIVVIKPIEESEDFEESSNLPSGLMPEELEIENDDETLENLPSKLSNTGTTSYSNHLDNWDFDSKESGTSLNVSTLSLNKSIPIPQEIEDLWTSATEDMWNFETANPIDWKLSKSQMSQSLYVEEIQIPLEVNNDDANLPSLPTDTNEEIPKSSPPEGVNSVPKNESAEEIIQKIFEKSKVPLVQRAFKMPEIKIPGFRLPEIETLSPEEIAEGNHASNFSQDATVEEIKTEPPIRQESAFHNKPVERTISEYTSFSDEFDSSHKVKNPPSNVITFDHSKIPDGLMASAMNIFDNLELESPINLSTITKQILNHYRINCDEIAPFQDQETLRALIDTALQTVSQYQNALERAFDQQVCFDTDQEFQKMTARINSKITLPQSHPFYDSAQDKMKQIITTFNKINHEIILEEEKAATYATQLITAFYNDTVNLNSCKNTEDLKSLHENTLQICKEAFQHAFDRPGSKIGNKMLTNLCDKLSNAYSILQKKHTDTLSRHRVTGSSLVEKFKAAYKSEMDRNFRNPVYNASHFQSLHDTASKNAIWGFKEESKTLLTTLQQTLEQELQKDIAEQRVIFKRNFDSSKPSPSHSTTEMVPYDEKSSSSQNQNNSSISTTTPVPKPRNTKNAQSAMPVGIHFALDKISAGIFKQDGTFQTIYGPKLNQISFDDEILISSIPQNAAIKKIFTMRKVLTNADIEKTYPVGIGGRKIEMRVEEIVAYIFAQLHEFLKRYLHSQRISYAVTYPSSFNKTMWNVLKDATQIAGIHAILVRESCAILTRQIHAGKVINKPKWILMAIEDPNPENKGSDIITYELQNNGILRLENVAGCGPGSKYLGLSGTSGMEECLYTRI